MVLVLVGNTNFNPLKESYAVGMVWRGVGSMVWLVGRLLISRSSIYGLDMHS